MAKHDSRFRVVQLTRNFGKEAALSAGLDHTTDAYIILIDADLQDPISLIGRMLQTRQVTVDAFKLFPEKQRFMKGLLSWVGFYTVTIDYLREPRAAGSSKFSGWKRWNFALEGITSFSTLPLRIWTYVGAIGALLTVV